MIAAGRATRLGTVGAGLLALIATGAVASTGTLWGEVGVVEALNSTPDLVIEVLALVMQLGTMPFVFLAMAVVVAVAPGDWRRAGLTVVVAGALAWQLSDVAKEIVERPRPEVYSSELVIEHPASGFGWPSTHTAIATATLTSAAFACRRRATAALMLAAVVGVARMAVGVHLPLDVIGGLGLGLAVAAVVAAVVDP